MQQLFDKTKGWNFSVNLKGSFTTGNEFEITPKWQLIHIRGGGQSEIASIKGEIFQNEFKQTKVDFKVRPNSIIPVFFILLPVIGIFMLIGGKAKGNENTVMLIALCLTFLGPILLLVLGHQAKKGLKDRFVDTFGLRE
jgi:hypothetical protein